MLKVFRIDRECLNHMHYLLTLRPHNLGKTSSYELHLSYLSVCLWQQQRYPWLIVLFFEQQTVPSFATQLLYTCAFF